MLKMLHTNRGELQLLFDTFCRVWGSGGQATLTTTTQGSRWAHHLLSDLVLLHLPALPSPLRNASSQATLVLLLIIDAGAALATEDQQQKLDLEQEQLLTRLPWLLLHPPPLR